ncbi:MAG: methyltransferase [Saprospiraceae bacterium]
MTNMQSMPSQAIMMQMVNGKLVSRTISLVADLGIADLLKIGPKSVSELAKTTQSNEDALHRLLRMLSSIGIFSELGEGLYGNNSLSDVLQSDIPGSIRNYARWLGTQLHWEIIKNMDHAIQTGKPSFHRLYPDLDPFEALIQYPEDHQVFQEAMTGLSDAEGYAIAAAYDWTVFDTILDVGGGHGQLMSILAKKVPQTQFTVFDLPHVIEVTRNRLSAEGLNNIKAISGSFWDHIPGPVDLIVMKHIIHDWDDEQAIDILKMCKKALTPNGKIMVCEWLITENPDSISAKVLDIEMLTGPGGRERTAKQYDLLFQKAGLKLAQIVDTEGSIKLIEAKI